MAYSYITYTGDGSQTDWTFPFEYLEQAHVFAYVDGTEVPLTFINASAVRISPAAAAGKTVQIRRITAKADSPVNFADGSNLLERDLDLMATWALFQAQESADNSGDSTAALAAAQGSAADAAASAASAQSAAESAQIAASAFPAYIKKQTFVATAGQTLFTLPWSYSVGLGSLQVVINGVYQDPSAYTETSATSFTLSEALLAGDQVSVRSTAP